MRGAPSKGRVFFAGRPFDPLRAGITVKSLGALEATRSIYQISKYFLLAVGAHSLG